MLRIIAASLLMSLVAGEVAADLTHLITGLDVLQ